MFYVRFVTKANRFRHFYERGCVSITIKTRGHQLIGSDIWQIDIHEYSQTDRQTEINMDSDIFKVYPILKICVAEEKK